MPDFEKLYHKVFNGITAQINALVKLQQDVEEEYLKQCEEDDKSRFAIRLVKKEKSES